METKKLKYSAYTSNSDGTTFAHEGTVEEARKLAIAYAREAFPSGPDGYGPNIVVADAETGERLVEERL